MRSSAVWAHFSNGGQVQLSTCSSMRATHHLHNPQENSDYPSIWIQLWQSKIPSCCDFPRFRSLQLFVKLSTTSPWGRRSMGPLEWSDRRHEHEAMLYLVSIFLHSEVGEGTMAMQCSWGWALERHCLFEINVSSLSSIVSAIVLVTLKMT